MDESAEPGSRPTSRRRSRLVTCLAVAAVTAGAGLCGLAVLLAAAVVTPVPILSMTAAAIVFLAVAYAGAVLVTARRVSPGHRRTARRVAFTAGSLVPGAVFAWAALAPAPPSPATAMAGASPVQVSTGSTLTVIKLPARGGASRSPIVVVHGGPGVPELQDNAKAFASLTDQGFDVYLYAQLGTDGSTRLDDPRGYTRGRAVADLEGLRSRLGLSKVILIGHSNGGEIAARYLAAHPDRVAGLVLTSPGPLDPADTSVNLVSGRLDPARKAQLYGTLLQPRSLLGYLLLQVNPAAAHAFLPDAEADARNDIVLELARPALYCRGAMPAERPVQGTGFYAMQYPQSATAPRPSDPRPALAGLPTPTLIIKGSCDYLSWRSATTYRDLLPNSRLIYVNGAGHNVYHDGNTTVVAAITAFLTHRPLPLPSYTAAAPPAGYEGPP
ncbi:alpha/beta hydrolase [Microbispora sp. GKU 823]|uniref:alpha/beta hydrolase n=1 Tax=Microbispora sp. GKU 823 TaxID=1652100 RepID=UPI0009A421DE|nr:alpha/beta hydrolase [Microbispora sp. GKU 823]